MNWLKKLRAVARLLIDWDIFKHAFDDTVKDPSVRAKLDAMLSEDPVLAANYATLRALWAPVERDLRDLK